MGLLFLRLVAAPLLRMLYELCAMGWLFLVPGLVLWVRLAAAPLRCLLRRPHALRDRSGQRRRASMDVFGEGSEIVLPSTSDNSHRGAASDSPRSRRRLVSCYARAYFAFPISRVAQEQL